MQEIEIRILTGKDTDVEEIMQRVMKSVVLAHNLGYEGIEWEHKETYVKVQFCSMKRQLQIKKV